MFHEGTRFGSWKKWVNVAFFCFNVACLVALYLTADFRVTFQFAPVVLAACITGAAALIGAGVALRTLLTNQRQQQEHFEGRQRAEQERFDRQELANEFKDILDRLADNENSLMRASAANRLAEVGMRRLPGRPDGLTPENYPFFPRAVAQLAAALHFEVRNPVREEIGKALRRLADFGKGGDQQLLLLQVRDLADANRSAKVAFMEALAEYRVSLAMPGRAPVADDSFLEQLVQFTTFCDTDGKTFRVLQDLVATIEYQRAVAFRLALRGAQGADTKNNDESALKDVWASAARLRDTRDALSSCLINLKAPPDAPTSPNGVGESRRSSAVDLNNCFLCGAKLASAEFAGVSFWGAFLQGSYLLEANLQGANLVHARLTNADLSGAKLDGAWLSHSRFENADFSDAHLTGTVIPGNGRWVMRPASVTTPYFNANFYGANWWDAAPESWILPPGKRLRQWLNDQYPRPE